MKTAGECPDCGWMQCRCLPDAPDVSQPVAAEHLTIKLLAWATQLAARFGAPVLLVGSALRKLHPRDVDVRIVIPDEEFEARYGVTWGRWSRGVNAQRWIDDMAKLGRSQVLTYRINLDFQVHAAGYIRAHNLAGPAIVLAAPSDCEAPHDP